MKVMLDLQRCQGYVCCVMEAPGVFDIDDDAGKAVLLREEPEESVRERVEAAARACPTSAISVSPETSDTSGVPGTVSS